MAKKAMIGREKKRARLVAKFVEKRAALKEIANDNNLPKLIRTVFFHSVNNLGLGKSLRVRIEGCKCFCTVHCVPILLNQIYHPWKSNWSKPRITRFLRKHCDL